MVHQRGWKSFAFGPFSAPRLLHATDDQSSPVPAVDVISLSPSFLRTLCVRAYLLFVLFYLRNEPVFCLAAILFAVQLLVIVVFCPAATLVHLLPASRSSLPLTQIYDQES